MIRKLLPGLRVPSEAEESRELPDKLRRLVSAMKGLLHYGGPHPGPAPGTTTEMLLALVLDLIRYLARMLNERLVEYSAS